MPLAHADPFYSARRNVRLPHLLRRNACSLSFWLHKPCPENRVTTLDLPAQAEGAKETEPLQGSIRAGSVAALAIVMLGLLGHAGPSIGRVAPGTKVDGAASVVEKVADAGYHLFAEGGHRALDHVVEHYTELEDQRQAHQVTISRRPPVRLSSIAASWFYRPLRGGFRQSPPGSFCRSRYSSGENPIRLAKARRRGRP